MFFDRVSKFSRIINISNITIHAKDKPEPNSTITADCVATTFVLLESREGRRRPGGKGELVKAEDNRDQNNSCSTAAAGGVRGVAVVAAQGAAAAQPASRLAWPAAAASQRGARRPRALHVRPRRATRSVRQPGLTRRRTGARHESARGSAGITTAEIVLRGSAAEPRRVRRADCPGPDGKTYSQRTQTIGCRTA